MSKKPKSRPSRKPIHKVFINADLKGRELDAAIENALTQLGIPPDKPKRKGKTMSVTMMRLPDGTRVPRPCNWCHTNPAENGNTICVSCQICLTESKHVTMAYRRGYLKRDAQARVKAGFPTPKAERTRIFNERMARKAAKATEPKPAS